MEMEVSFPGGKKVNSTYKGFTVKTDQSKNDGGNGAAPEPYDLFLASIGTVIYGLSRSLIKHVCAHGTNHANCSNKKP